MSSNKNKPNPVQQAAAMSTPSAVHEPEAQIALKEETLKWICAILCSLLVYAVVASVIQSVYNPDINILKEEAKKLLIGAGAVRPEPVEAMLFRAGVIILGFGMMGFYMLFSKMKQMRELAQKPVFLLLTSLCIVVIAGLIYYDFAAQNPFAKDGGDTPQNSRDFSALTNFDFYFDGFFMGSYAVLYTAILVPLLSCLFLIGMKKYNWENAKPFKTGANVIGYGVLAWVIIACVTMSAFYFPYTFENKYNFNAVYYSVTQVYAGLPMLVDGFTNTYGLYPHFLNPIFQVTGLSVVTFSSVMATLLGMAFVLNFLSLRRLVSNSIILFLGMFSVIYFPFLDFKLGQAFDCNFAVYPIRYIIPSVLIFLAVLYFNKRPAVVYWITMVVMACFVLWNPEVGLVCYLAWLATNTFSDFYNSDGKADLKKIIFHWVAGILTAVVVFYLYKGIIYLAYGSAPDLSSLFNTILVFGKVGFNMLPMKLVHPWNLMVIVLIAGFMYSISKWSRKEVTPKTSVMFLVSVLALGYFFYFQGRSHNWQLAQSSGMTFFLLTMLGDELWEKVKKNNVLALNAFFVVFLFAISFSFFEILYNTDNIKEMMSQETDKEKDPQEMQRVEGNADFIAKNSKEGEKIFVFTSAQYEGLYYGMAKRRSAFNPGGMDMFLNSDLPRLEKVMSDSSFNIFVEQGQSFFQYPNGRILGAVAASCEYKSGNGSMNLFARRKTKMPANTFFTGDAVLHRKYTDDKAGTALRINDGQGLPVTAVSGEFAVEVLFYTGSQVFPYATVVGNMDDTSGFILAKIPNSPNYFFGVNGKGFGVPLPDKQWVYCVMNVFADRVDVYVNGAYETLMKLPAAAKQSPQNPGIGNLGFMRHYIGAISEVSIRSKPMDKTQVEATWNAMKPQL